MTVTTESVRPSDSLRAFLVRLFERRSRFLLHGSVLALGLFVVGMNAYSASNSDIVRAERNLLAQLVFPDQDQYEVVTADTTRRTSTASYLPSAISVASAASAEGSLTDDFALVEETTDPYKVPSIGGNTLVKGSLSETKESFKPRTAIVKHTVKAGESISYIAATYGVDVATILQENETYANDIIKTGDELSILPFSGSTERVEKEDSLKDIAKKHGVSVDTLMEDNQLESEEDVEFAQILLVRDGKRDAYIGARPIPQAQRAVASASTGSTTSSANTSSGSSAGSGATSAVSGTAGTATPPAVVTPGSRVGNRFPWGWCTWFVAETRGDVTWRGNAGDWLANAQAQGKPTGRIPAVGAILVTNESWWGHVAYVEAVNGDQVSVVEMNYAGFGVVSRRTISNGSPKIKGYIY